MHILCHISAALSKLKVEMHCPSMLIRIKQSSVVVLSLFLKEVLIRFIAEKERSHSAVLTGMIAATTN